MQWDRRRCSGVGVRVTPPGLFYHFTAAGKPGLAQPAGISKQVFWRTAFRQRRLGRVTFWRCQRCWPDFHYPNTYSKSKERRARVGLAADALGFRLAPEYLCWKSRGFSGVQSQDVGRRRRPVGATDGDGVQLHYQLPHHRRQRHFARLAARPQAPVKLTQPRIMPRRRLRRQV